MSLLLIAPNRDMQPWKEALSKADPNLDVEVWPEVADKKKVQFAVSWNHPKHSLDSYPNLKAVSSLGAGVDHILRDDTLPGKVQVCRVVCRSLVRQMKEYVLNALLNYQRNTLTYIQQKQKGVWEMHPNKAPGEFIVGVMGLGELGRPVAVQLAELGYRVRGWSRSKKEVAGVDSFAGEAELEEFLSQTTVLVCLLPLTPKTEGILDLELFKELKHPAYLVNVARGEHLVEEDLIYAVDKGWMEGAALDVFSEEPLPERHPFWSRANIMITPHVSSLTPPEEVAEQLVENYKRVLSGMEPLNRVDKEKGY